MNNAPFPITIDSNTDLVLIRTDVSMAATLQEASDALDAAIAIVSIAASRFQTASLDGAITLIQLAKGMTDATIGRAIEVDEREACHGA